MSVFYIFLCYEWMFVQYENIKLFQNAIKKTLTELKSLKLHKHKYIYIWRCELYKSVNKYNYST